MSYVKSTNNPQFIAQFYETCVKPAGDLNDCLLVHCEGYGFSLENKNSYFVTRAFHRYWQKVSYDLTANGRQLLEAIKLSKQSNTDSIQASQVCFAIDKIARHVLEKKKDFSDIQKLQKELEELGFEFLRKGASQARISRLRLALQNGMMQAALHLIEAASPDDPIKDAKGHLNALLHLAYSQSRFTLCRKLIENGADPKKAFGEIVAQCATKLLPEALKLSQEAVVIKLVEAGANLKTSDGFDDGAQALHIAAKNGLQTVIPLMLARGADINGRDSGGNTALHGACRSLQLTTCQLLISVGADVACLNYEGQPALVLPSTLPNAQAKVAAFYSALFAEYHLDQKELTRQGIGPFLSRCRNDPSEYLFSNDKVNPFELALFFQDEQLAKSCANALKTETFIQCLEALRKKYPKCNLDIVEFCHIEISPRMFEVSLPDISLKEPSRDASLERLLMLFDTCDFQNPKSPSYYDRQKTKKNAKVLSAAELKAVIRSFIIRIKQREELPKESDSARLKNLYTLVETCIKNIIITLEGDPNHPEICRKKAAFFQEIVRLQLGEQCAGIYFFVAQDQYRKICRNIDRELDDEEEFHYLLADYKELLLQAVVDTSPGGKDNTNEHNKLLLELGDEYAIPGHETTKYYVEQMGSVDHYRKAKSDFKRVFNPTNIVRHCIEPALREDGRLREKYINWWKQKMPTNWRKNESKETREHSFLQAARIYDAQNRLSPHAICCMLAQLEYPVLSSSKLTLPQQRSSRLGFLGI